MRRGRGVSEGSSRSTHGTQSSSAASPASKYNLPEYSASARWSSPSSVALSLRITHALMRLASPTAVLSDVVVPIPAGQEAASSLASSMSPSTASSLGSSYVAKTAATTTIEQEAVEMVAATALEFASVLSTQLFLERKERLVKANALAESNISAAASSFSSSFPSSHLPPISPGDLIDVVSALGYEDEAIVGRKYLVLAEAAAASSLAASAPSSESHHHQSIGQELYSLSPMTYRMMETAVRSSDGVAPAQSGVDAAAPLTAGNSNSSSSSSSSSSNSGNMAAETTATATCAITGSSIDDLPAGNSASASNITRKSGRQRKSVGDEGLGTALSISRNASMAALPPPALLLPIPPDNVLLASEPSSMAFAAALTATATNIPADSKEFKRVLRTLDAERAERGLSGTEDLRLDQLGRVDAGGEIIKQGKTGGKCSGTSKASR